MRTSFVLIMVLALATSAQAALSLSLSATTVAVGNDVTVGVWSDNSESWTRHFVLSEDTYWWTDPIAAAYNGVTILPPAGDMGGWSQDSVYAAVINLWTGGNGITGGEQFRVHIKGVQPGTIYLQLQDEVGPGIPPMPLTLVVVPEPMTISLLSLGGLLLRRSRKNLKL